MRIEYDESKTALRVVLFHSIRISNALPSDRLNKESIYFLNKT